MPSRSHPATRCRARSTSAGSSSSRSATARCSSRLTSSATAWSPSGGVGAAATVYVTSLFFFSLPVLITALFRAFRPALSMPELFHGVGILYRTSSAAAPDSAGMLWLVPLLLVLGQVWIRAERRASGPGSGGPEVARASHPPVPGSAILLATAALAGAYTAVRLHFPAGQTLLFAPYDALALLGIALASALLARVALHPVAGFEFALQAVAAGVLLLALGRSASDGLAAAAAWLVPIGVRIVPRRALAPAFALALAGACFCAFAAGYGL